MNFSSFIAAVLPLLGPYLSSVCSAGTANSIRPVLQPFSNLPLHRLSADTDIDPRFTVRLGYNVDVQLPQLSCLFNALDAFALLATKDFNGRMQGFSSSFSSTYPDVVVEILPSPNVQVFETRFAVWGLYEAVSDMILRHRYLEAIFGLYFEGSHVARISFHSSMHMNETTHISPGASSSARSLIPVSSTSSLLSTKYQVNATSTNNTNPYYGLRMLYLDGGRVLSIESVFLAVISTLEYVSKYPQHDRVVPFREVIVVGRGCILEFTESPRPESMMPQPFLYRSVIQAAKKIPYRMVQDDRYSESLFTMLVSGTEVGRGFIMDLQDRPSAMNETIT